MTALYGAEGADGRRLAWPLLAWAVRDFWGWPSLPLVERSPRGKPFFWGMADRWLSLSHSGGLALCALSGDGPVGVDVELDRPRRAGLPAYALSPAELARFDGSWEEFFRLWTLKESWCKREDAPLFPPRAVETPPPCPHKSYAGAGWRGAICCSGPPPEGIRWVAAENLRTCIHSRVWGLGKGFSRQTRRIFPGILCALQESAAQYGGKRPVQTAFEVVNTGS